MEDRCPLAIGGAAGELEGDDCEPGDVVDAIARLPARDHAGGVLNDPDVVDQCPKMVRPDRRELELHDRDRLSPRLGRSGLPKHDRRLRGDRRPGELGSDPPRLRAGCSQ